MLSDGLLLADAFERFRTPMITYFDQDPAHRLTLPQFGQQSLLRGYFARRGDGPPKPLALPLMSDEEHFKFCEAGKRGGLTSVGFKKYVEANNPYCPWYDPKKPRTWILNLDAVSLYPTTMLDKLPHGDFRFLEDDLRWEGCWGERTRSFDPEGERGQFLEVDVYCPEEFHDLQSDLPGFPETLSVTPEHIGETGRRQYKKYYGADFKAEKDPKKNTRLVANLLPKTRYVVHIRTLRFYTEVLGWRVTKVHRILDFHQERFMKDWVQFCAERRGEASRAGDKFEVGLWKLLMVSNFGKLMENVRKRMNYTLVTERKQALKIQSRGRFKKAKIYDENLVGFIESKKVVRLDRPVHAGAGVLDLSKLHLYEWFYEKARVWFPGCRLLYTDTDSLYLWIETEDVYADLLKHAEDLDLSGYPKNHPCYRPENAKRLGKIADEQADKVLKDGAGKPVLDAEGRPQWIGVIQRAVFLKAKCKFIELIDGSVTCTAKGNKEPVRNAWSFENAVAALEEEVACKLPSVSFRSHEHRVFTEEGWKRGLNPFDPKRWADPDGLHTYPIGHYLAKGPEPS